MSRLRVRVPAWSGAATFHRWLVAEEQGSGQQQCSRIRLQLDS